MQDFLETPWFLPAVCAVISAAVVSAAYLSPYTNRLAIPAAMPGKFPLRAFARAFLLVYLLLFIIADQVLLHSFPVTSGFIGGGFLLLLSMPSEAPDDGVHAGD